MRKNGPRRHDLKRSGICVSLSRRGPVKKYSSVIAYFLFQQNDQIFYSKPFANNIFFLRGGGEEGWGYCVISNVDLTHLVIASKDNEFAREQAV